MLFWLFFATMTGAAVFAVLWPLAFSRVRIAGEAEADLAVYRDQLAEIDRDRARNLIGEREAEAARLEVSRRILALDSIRNKTAAKSDALWRRRAIASLAIVAVPAMAIGVYAVTGSPQLPDAPLAARLNSEPSRSDVMILVRRIEDHLAKNPADGRGWELLGPVYLMYGRFADAVKARSNAIKLLGSTPQREADLGEALVAVGEGSVTPEAQQAFERALAAEPGNPKAAFFKGLAAAQAGNDAGALETWKLLAASETSGPWRNEALRRIQMLERKQ